MGAVLALIGNLLINHLVFVHLAVPLPLFEFQLITLSIKDVLLLEKAELALLEFFFCSDQLPFLLLDD